MNTKECVSAYLSAAMNKRLAFIGNDFFDDMAEMRIRVDKPLFLYRHGMEYQISRDGRLLDSQSVCGQSVYKPAQGDIAEMLERISQYSLYAFEEELRLGYITLPGGHRVGITGRTALQGRRVRTLHYINGLNLRIAHQIPGCADTILPWLRTKGLRPLSHTMIISPPGCGKTTVLRDLIRQISNGTADFPGMTVGVVDERSEIAGCYKGAAQNDVGPRTDVLDGCPKAEGMIMLLRAMSPEVIAVDELGGENDARALEDIYNAGVRLLCTVHGRDLGDIRLKPALRELLDKRVFERFVVLQAPGKITGVFDADHHLINGTSMQ